MATKQEVY